MSEFSAVAAVWSDMIDLDGDGHGRAGMRSRGQCVERVPDTQPGTWPGRHLRSAKNLRTRIPLPPPSCLNRSKYVRILASGSGGLQALLSNS